MILFDQVSLAKAVEVQKRCYRFLQLLKYDQLPLAGGWSIGALHADAANEAERFRELVIAHFDDLPEAARPVSSADDDLTSFANFFVSYLLCSFEFVSEPRLVQLDKSFDGSCWCELCARLTNAPNLKLKKVSGRDKAIADSLEADALAKLLEAAKKSPTGDEIKEILEDAKLAGARALVAYGIELIRRGEGEYVDASSLVLWRRFAWENGVPKKDFALTAGMIEKAEEGLASRLNELVGA